MSTEEKKTSSFAKAGKYLTFKLSSEEYGLEILKVQEIIGLLNVTRIPKMPSYVKGIINLRGKLIPVIDIRLKFGMSAQQETDKTCIIVVQFKTNELSITMGVIVDNVSEVLNILENQIEATPSFGSNFDTSYLMGIGKVGTKVVMLLNIDKVLIDSEFENIYSTLETNQDAAPNGNESVKTIQVPTSNENTAEMKDEETGEQAKKSHEVRAA